MLQKSAKTSDSRP